MANKRRHERRAERVAAQVPIRFKGSVAGKSRDVSTTGVYLVMDREIAAGQPIRFALELDAGPGGQLALCCEGVVLRVEANHGIRGVAVALESSRLVPRAQCRC